MHFLFLSSFNPPLPDPFLRLLLFPYKGFNLHDKCAILSGRRRPFYSGERPNEESSQKHWKKEGAENSSKGRPFSFSIVLLVSFDYRTGCVLSHNCVTCGNSRAPHDCKLETPQGRFVYFTLSLLPQRVYNCKRNIQKKNFPPSL